MAKGKDPAFLFYPNDFDVKTKFMTHEQVGKYMRLLITQFQFGPLTKEQMDYVCGGICDGIIMQKFEQDENGLYYNERLSVEVEKRKAHSKKQSENARMRWHKDGIANAMPLENENENENEDSRVSEKGKEGAGRKGKFVKPTEQELESYIVEKFPDISLLQVAKFVEEFMDHYESNGWMVGRVKMKDWKRAANKWVRNSGNFKPKKDSNDRKKSSRDGFSESIAKIS